MRAEFLSHVGAVRENNEDAIYCDVKSGVFVVADGIGGKEAGEIASATAVRVVAEKSWEDPDAEPAVMLREAFYEANNFIYNRGKEPGMAGMGTTMTAAVIRGNKITIVHVGDSRAYLFTAEGVQLLTTDHSIVEFMVQRGELTQEQAKNHPGKNVITRAVGTEPSVEGDIYLQKLHRDDCLLLCSDGLSNVMADQEMLFEVAHGVRKSDCCQRLLRIAKNRGAPDNVTVAMALV